MSKAKGMGGKKKGKKTKKEEEPAPDLLDKDGDSLKTMINIFRDKLTDLKSKRNYAQDERDLIEQFYSNTRHDIEESKIKIANKETEAEQLEENHRVEVKVYLQKVKHLEYDQKLTNKKIRMDGDAAMNAEETYNKNRLLSMQEDKTKKKKELVDNEREQQAEVKQQQQQQEKTLKKLKGYYDSKIETMINNYEDQLKRLKEELELKIKVEIHEIEERKNQHINDLMRNHDAAFAELKSYYNDITRENLNVIKGQKQDIENLQGSLLTNSKQITEIKAKNKKAEEPLMKNRKLRDDMKYALRQHEKDKMSLANLKIKIMSLRDRIRKLEREQEEIDKKYASILQEKKTLEDRFEDITNEVKTHAEVKNELLSKRLNELQDQLEYKETQLQQLIQRAAIDPTVTDQLLGKIQQSIEGKNGLVKNLRYSIHHATKAYNDAIRVYEAKLTDFGVPPEELGFQPLESKTSTMPAGLVSS